MNPASPIPVSLLSARKIVKLNKSYKDGVSVYF